MSRSPGPSLKFVAETKLNSLVYFVYTLPAVCTVQPGARLVSVEVALIILKMENRHTDRFTHRGSYRVRPGPKIS